ncbi:hypothetical protein HYU14_06930 [Candidatus Woesearchaeota archaeon]|nr:hypothetical protein [Candidatus Woesearchaeota archaeon]
MDNGFLQRPVAVIGDDAALNSLIGFSDGNCGTDRKTPLEIIMDHYDGRRLLNYQSLALLEQHIRADRPSIAFWLLPSDPFMLTLAYTLNGSPPLADLQRASAILGSYSPFQIVAVKPSRSAYHLQSPIITVRAKDLAGYLRQRVEPGFRRPS